jgi:hypothetical protein
VITGSRVCGAKAGVKMPVWGCTLPFTPGAPLDGFSPGASLPALDQGGKRRSFGILTAMSRDATRTLLAATSVRRISPHQSAINASIVSSGRSSTSQCPVPSSKRIVFGAGVGHGTRLAGCADRVETKAGLERPARSGPPCRALASTMRNDFYPNGNIPQRTSSNIPLLRRC